MTDVARRPRSWRAMERTSDQPRLLYALVSLRSATYTLTRAHSFQVTGLTRVCVTVEARTLPRASDLTLEQNPQYSVLRSATQEHC